MPSKPSGEDTNSRSSPRPRTHDTKSAITSGTGCGSAVAAASTSGGWEWKNANWPPGRSRRPRCPSPRRRAQPCRYPRTVTATQPERIFHIATAADWRRTLETGTYTTSTIGRTLEEEGFIHASRRDQVQGVFDRYYRGAGEHLVQIGRASCRERV